MPPEDRNKRVKRSGVCGVRIDRRSRLVVDKTDTAASRSRRMQQQHSAANPAAPGEFRVVDGPRGLRIHLVRHVPA